MSSSNVEEEETSSHSTRLSERCVVAREMALLLAALCFVCSSLIFIQIWMISETMELNKILYSLEYGTKNLRETFTVLFNNTAKGKHTPFPPPTQPLERREGGWGKNCYAQYARIVCGFY